MLQLYYKIAFLAACCLMATALATARASEWRPCAQLELATGWHGAAESGAAFDQLTRRVRLRHDALRLECLCEREGRRMRDDGSFTIALLLRNKHSESRVNVTVAAACQEALTCDAASSESRLQLLKPRGGGSGVELTLAPSAPCNVSLHREAASGYVSLSSPQHLSQEDCKSLAPLDGGTQLVFATSYQFPFHVPTHQRTAPPHLTVIETLTFDLNSCIRQLTAYPHHRQHKVGIFAATKTAVQHRGDIHDRERRQSASNTQPTFTSLYFLVSVEENVAVGTLVTTVQAFDPDPGPAGELEYSMQPANDLSSGNLFTIGTTSGIITTTAAIDRERISSHEFRVTARDHGSPPRSQVTTYAIEVDDLNDNVPTFLMGSYYNRTIPEDLDINDSALEMIVFDEDAGSNAAVEYTLINNTGDVFGIFSSGTAVHLTVVRALDYESRIYYHLVLIAQDMGSPSQSSCAVIDIHISDVADSPPVFNATSYSVTVAENTSVSSQVITVYASSQDSPSLARVEYHIIGGNSNSRFHLDLNTGVITLLGPLDFENTQSYALTVRAQSVANSQLRVLVSVFVTVTNINDHSPTFSRVQYMPSVSELVSLNHHIVAVNAEDLDLGILGEVTYRFDNSTVETVFNLDPSNGVITTAILLDREVQDVYSFFVIASDGGNPPRSASVRVEVRVTDVNDEAPAFPLPEYSADVAENVNEGTFVIQVQAEDEDAGSTALQYFIESGNLHNAFSIGPNDGEITTQGPLNREDIAMYSLTVVASDGQQEGHTVVRVNITDINDELPVFDLDLYEALDVSEGLAVTSEVIRLRAIDADAGSNGLVTYTSPDISPKFSLHASMGVVSLAQPLDYEEERGYSFTVYAEDGGSSPLSSSARVEISVLDENDNRPIFANLPLPSVSISENLPAQTSVIQLMASDADSGTNAVLHYSIVGDSRAMQAFGVMASTGLVHTRRSLDRETQDEYEIVVRVSDSGDEPLSSTVTVTVNILDVTDYNPAFTQIVYEKVILNFTREHTILLTVVAMSRDTNPNILYAITGGGNSSLFYIHQQYGTIHAARDIDPVAHSGEYSLQVTAQHRFLSSVVPVNILVARDDGIPRLRPLVLYFNVFHSQTERVNHLGTVEVLERRGHLNYIFSLNASDSRVLRHFTIAPATGEISVLNSVTSGYFALNVSAATSTGTGYVSVEAYIAIVTNATLESAVSVTFTGTEAAFASLFLEPFASFVAESIPCRRDRVEVFGIQTLGDERDSLIELALAVRGSGLTEYLPQETVLNLLDTHRHLARPEALQDFGTDVCLSEPCANLQSCQPVIQLFKASPASAFTTVGLTDRVYVSQPFRQSFTCRCLDGYAIDDNLCSSEVDECSPNPCHFGAECEDLLGDYRCDCPSDTTGKDCSIVCPSASCDPCSPSPCLHAGSQCSTPPNLAPGTYVCSNCPWGEDYSGPNCELTTLSFIAGSYAAFPPIGSAGARFSISLRFATVAPNGLLLYTGRVRGQGDFIAIQLVIGQLQVGVSLGGVATVLRTESLWQLNNQEWHTVEVDLKNNELQVAVSGCSNSSVFLAGDEESCRLEARISGEHRTLDVSTPLYIGGLEPFISSSDVSRSSFDGCISDVYLSGRLLDLATPLRSYGTQNGCPALEGPCSCALSGGGGDCVRAWNGSVCINADVVSSSIHLSPGYLHLAESSTSIHRISFAFRTRTTDTVLLQIGSSTSITLRLGSVVYTQGQNDEMGLTALTLSLDGFANDGLWHSLLLQLTDTHTELSIDDGRISSRLPESSGSLSISNLTFGSDTLSLASSRFTGCLSSLVLNSYRVDFATALTDGVTDDGVFDVTSEGGAVGCDGGEGCEGVECPSDSTCQPGWRSHSCVCNGNFQPLDGECQDPCSSNPCQNGGTCHTITSGFTCDCRTGFLGGFCQDQSGAGCPHGFHSPPAASLPCQRCVCAPQGVTADVCASSTGECVCKADVALFSRSGDLGCKSCDCHMPGSASPECDEATGQCVCVADSVMGRSCDLCAEGYAGLDEHGCHGATVVHGSFSLEAVGHSRAYDNDHSEEFLALSSSLAALLELEMYQFGLPGRFEVKVTAPSESSALPGVTVVAYTVANYFLEDFAHPTRPLPSMLSGAVQTVVRSGSLGHFLINTSSHIVPILCSDLPFVCGGCPPGSELSGITCQATLPDGCNGADSDRDGLPDACDLCPFIFDPTQANERSCDATLGVCPGGVASNTLWAATSSGSTDIKPCPAPFIGFTSRPCEVGGEWGEVDNSSCISAQGQDLLTQAQSLSEGRLLTEMESLFLAEQLRAFTSSAVDSFPLAGDVQSAGRLLSQLVTLVGYLRGNAGAMATLQVLAETASNLLEPALRERWVGVVKEAGFGSEDLLSAMENFPRVVILATRGASPSSSNRFDEENLSILTETTSLEDASTSKHFHIPISNRLSASVTLPPDIQSSPQLLEIALAHIATLSEVLPERPSSELVENFTAGTPLLSIQLWDAQGQAVIDLPAPVNFTLQYREQLLRPEAVSEAVCVSWHFGVIGGWRSDGCEVVGVNSSHCSCSCDHLSAFAVLLPRSAFGEIIVSLEYNPAIFTYIVLGCVCVILLATLVILSCVRSAEGLQNTVHKNQVAALFFTTLLFAVGINRTEVAGVCSAVGVGLMFVLLSCQCWLLVDTIVIARLLLQTRPPRKFLVYLIIIGWVFPLLLCGIPAGVVSIVTESFVEDLGFPRYCWLAPSVVYAYVAPAVLLLVLYAVGAVFCVVLISRMKKPEDSERTLVGVAISKHKASVSLCVSVAVTVLFVLTWLFGFLAVYGYTYLEYPFAILYAALGMLLFVVLCLNSKVRDGCRAQLKQGEGSSLQHAGLGSSTLSGRFEFFSRHPSEATPHSVRPSRPALRGYTNQLGLIPSPHPSTLTTLPRTHPNDDDDDDKPPTPPPHPPYLPPLTNHNQHSNRGQENGLEDTIKDGNNLAQPWFTIPEPVPLSPLPCHSDAGSEASNGRRDVSRDDDIDDYTSSLNATNPYHRRRTRGEDEEEEEDSSRTNSPESYLEFSSENLHHGQQVHTPSSSLLPPRSASQSQDATTQSSETKEDPLWYNPRDSGNFEMLPMPYETAAKALEQQQQQQPSPPQQRSVKWRDLEERGKSAEVMQNDEEEEEEGEEPVILLSSPRNSSLSSSSTSREPTGFHGNLSLSSTSSSHSGGSRLREGVSPRPFARITGAPSPEEMPVFRETHHSRDNSASGGLNSHHSPLPRRQNAKGIPRTSSASESLRHCIKHSPPPPHAHTPPAIPPSHRHHPATQQRAAMIAAPPSPYNRAMARTASDNSPSVPHCPVHHTASYQSPPNSNVTTSSLQAQVGLPGLPAVEVPPPQALAAPPGGGDKPGGLDGYHSEGPSVEARLNQVIRHSDGSETVQSLV